MVLNVFIPGLPVPKQSFRFGKGGGWQPARVKQYQRRAHFAAASAMREQGWRRVQEGHPVKVVLVFVYPLPKATKKAARKTWVYRTGRPDVDNLAKGTLDSLSAAGVWDDDQQVAVLHIIKTNAPRGEEGVRVYVERIHDPNFRFESHGLEGPEGLPIGAKNKGPD